MIDASDGKLDHVPLFPLPNVVLFPRAVLPLHIFEERYKTMTADALAGDRLIAMALLQPGWEKNYYSRPAVEPVVCVGRIVTHELLGDGKYNFLLEGQQRARIVSECKRHAYRTAKLEPFAESPVIEIDLTDERSRLISIFSDEHFAFLPLVNQFRQMLRSPLGTEVIADVLAFNLIDSVALKQQLLGDADVRRRVNQVIRSLEALRPLHHVLAHRRVEDPSMN